MSTRQSSAAADDDAGHPASRGTALGVKPLVGVGTSVVVSTEIDATLVRIATPRDVPALQAFVQGLSTLSRAARFFVPVAELPQMLVEAIESGDRRHHLLVALDGAGAQAQVVALAQYAILDADADTCDIAVVVTDARQRRGLGGRLLLRLIEDARRAGLLLAQGDVLRYNRAMLSLARRTGFEVRRHPDDATLVKIALPLKTNETMAASRTTTALLAA